MLIVGASRGVGLATAVRLAADGHQVCSWSRTGGPVDEVDPELPIRWLGVDACDAAAVRSAFAAEPDAADAVVYTAAIARWGEVGAQSLDEWREVVDVNLVGAVTVMSCYLETYRRHPARVVAVASDAVFFPGPARSAYHASKAALASFFESYRLEARASQTIVTLLYLGKTNTRLSPRRPESNARALDPADVAATIAYVLGLAPHVEVRSIELSSIRSPYKGVQGA